jgi:hypothetical protein
LRAIQNCLARPTTEFRQERLKRRYPDQRDRCTLSNATGDTMEKGKVVVEHMVERAREMEQVKLELDEYKRIANTDPLTRLANRRAFDEMLSNIYNDKRARDVSRPDRRRYRPLQEIQRHLWPPGRRQGAGRCRRGDEKHAAQGCFSGPHRRRGIRRHSRRNQPRGHDPRLPSGSAARSKRRRSRTRRPGLDYGPITLSLGHMHGQRCRQRRGTLQQGRCRALPPSTAAAIASRFTSRN